MEVIIQAFEDLTKKERAAASDNGSGAKYATYVRVVHNGDTLFLENDAMEPEDATFWRDLEWVPKAIATAYELGLSARDLSGNGPNDE